MEFTFQGKVTQHRINKFDDATHSIVEIEHPAMKYVTMDIYVPRSFPLGTHVFVTVSDSEPEGGAAQ